MSEVLKLWGWLMETTKIFQTIKKNQLGTVEQEQYTGYFKAKPRNCIRIGANQ
jgi:hypothetical protein